MAFGHVGAEPFVGSALRPRTRSRIVLPVAAEFFPVHHVVAGAGIIGTVASLLVVAEVRRTAPGQASDTERRDGADRHMTSR
ncbi:hypothetical protein AMK21_14960 [Streptomyces sp. CB00316]|nr:hypothetical protein AMK21_14960 [Streptomyces sp. CB00316]